jgi:hypothetical protein
MKPQRDTLKIEKSVPDDAKIGEVGSSIHYKPEDLFFLITTSLTVPDPSQLRKCIMIPF